MPKTEVSKLRNIAFVGHGDAGKTSLAEVLLYKMGATSRLGEVDTESSLCDTEPDEKERKNSIDCAIVYGDWKNIQINLLDAPGYPDFVGEAISALAAVDTAFLFINASSGIMVNTRKMWEYIAHRQLPCIIVVNKLDQENIRLSELFQDIKEAFGNNCLPYSVPVGLGSELSQVVSLFDTPADKLPEEWSDGSMKDRLIESVIEVDDDLLNKYLEGDELTQEELSGALRKAIITRKVVPILSVSAKEQIGVEELLNFIVDYIPSPADLGSKKGYQPVSSAEAEKIEKEIPPDPNAPFSAQVFKSVSDPFVGKLSCLRVFSGTLSADSSIYNARTKKDEKVSKVFKTFGKEQRPVSKVIAGDIVTLTKVENVMVSDTFCMSNEAIEYAPLEVPQPMVSLAIEPKSKGDEQRLSLSLTKTADSDITFKVVRNRQTKELVISGISSLHLDIILKRLQAKYDVQIVTKPPKIPYKETITIKSEGHYKHKKQTGGHGQYGEVYLRLEPLPRGEGFKFVDETFGGAIPNQYLPAVEKGVREVMERGVIAGHIFVDTEVTVYDGSYHDVDSSEASFKIAATKAFQDGVKAGRPVLLEPVVNIEISIPMKYMGDITGDLNTRRGRISGMDSVGGQQVIKASIPQAEVTNYSTELRSMTAGEGHYTLEFSHYDVVPHKTQETIIARAKAQKEEES